MRGRGFFSGRKAMAVCGLAASLALCDGAVAQDAVGHRPHARHRLAASSAPVAYRGLTIDRLPRSAPDLYDNGQDIYRDGPIRYNDIRDFSPVPYVQSGRQYPFGLDGIGGYGSDLGFGAGHDTLLYDRGAFDPY